MMNARAFFSGLPGVASAFSVFGIAAGSPPSLRDGDLLRPHRAPYCLRAYSLCNLTEKGSRAFCSGAPASRPLTVLIAAVGNPLGMEARLAPKRGVAMERVDFGGVRGKGLRAILLLPFNLLRACVQSARLLARIRPNIVLGMGGYISVPVGLMALARRCPLIIHEQNAIAGLANRLLAKIARRALVAFPNALPRAQWTGNPVRSAFVHLPPPHVRTAQRSGPLRILVVGGSLGAAALNAIVPRALALLPRDALPSVVHQSGVQHLYALRAHYAAAGFSPDAENANIDLIPFIDDMADAYCKADLLICRAGASTVAEISAAGVAALFVPFPYAADDHQTRNAAFLSERGAAALVQQSELSPSFLADWIRAHPRARLLEMATQARALAMPGAAERVAEICVEIAARRGASG